MPSSPAACATTLVAAIFVISGPAVALDTGIWMDAAGLAETFKGKELDGEYASGRTFKEAYNADGGLRYQDDMRESGGHWSVSSGTFCTIYDDDPAGGCFRVQKIGANCFEFFFVARTEDKAPGPPDRDPSWTARAWFSSDAPTCKERVGV
jgi:hypothetical protein